MHGPEDFRHDERTRGAEKEEKEKGEKEEMEKERLGGRDIEAERKAERADEERQPLE